MPQAAPRRQPPDIPAAKERALTAEYKAGDEFLLKEHWARKCHWRIKSVDADGGIVATDLNRPGNTWADDVHAMPAGCIQIYEDWGLVEWLVLGGKPFVAPKEAEAEIREFIGNAEAAVEFLEPGAPIPYDIGSAGMLFEDEGPEAVITEF